jgi:hypothetical protein
MLMIRLLFPPNKPINLKCLLFEMLSNSQQKNHMRREFGTQTFVKMCLKLTSLIGMIIAITILSHHKFTNQHNNHQNQQEIYPILVLGRCLIQNLLHTSFSNNFDNLTQNGISFCI